MQKGPDIRSRMSDIYFFVDNASIVLYSIHGPAERICVSSCCGPPISPFDLTPSPPSTEPRPFCITLLHPVISSLFPNSRNSPRVCFQPFAHSLALFIFVISHGSLCLAHSLPKIGGIHPHVACPEPRGVTCHIRVPFRNSSDRHHCSAKPIFHFLSSIFRSLSRVIVHELRIAAVRCRLAVYFCIFQYKPYAPSFVFFRLRASYDKKWGEGVRCTVSFWNTPLSLLPTAVAFTRGTGFSLCSSITAVSYQLPTVGFARVTEHGTRITKHVWLASLTRKQRRRSHGDVFVSSSTRN